VLQIGLFKRKDAKALKSTFLENQEIRRNRGEMWALRHYRKTKKKKCEHVTLTVIMTLRFLSKIDSLSGKLSCKHSSSEDSVRISESNFSTILSVFPSSCAG